MRRAAWWLAPLTALVALGGVVAEIAVLVWVSDRIGFWPTLLLVMATTIAGVLLARHEGLKAWKALTTTVASGHLPTGPLANGALVLLGGLLLVLPGFLSDLAGLLLLLPFTRPVIRSALGFIAARTVARRGRTKPVVVEGEVVEGVVDAEELPPGSDDTERG